MSNNFDQITPRRGTDSYKFDSAARYGKPDDLLPLWVADMDFPAPDCVLDALQTRVQHGVFGYTEPSSSYFGALKSWFTGRFGYTFDPAWVTLTPGVAFAICTAIRAFTAPFESVLIQEPVYYPFRESVLGNRRKLVVNNLQREGEKYSIDFIDFETQIVEHQVRLFILCSPHNPVGRVWQAEELREMVRICAKHDVLIFSDEIHCDFIFPGYTHHVLPALVPEQAGRMILATAPSKTFNLPGLQNSNIFIADPELRRTFRREVYGSGYTQPSAMGVVACRAAYSEGGPWLEALNTYLLANMIQIDTFLKTKLPQIRMIPPEGTYLAWLDCRALGLSPDELEHKLLHEAKLWLSRGDIFGSAGAGFLRINAACPRTTLDDCLNRMAQIL